MLCAVCLPFESISLRLPLYFCVTSHILHLSPLSFSTLPLPHSLSLGGMSHRRERRKETRGGVFVCALYLHVCVGMCVCVCVCVCLCVRMCCVIPPEVQCPSHSFSASCQPCCWSPDISYKGTHNTYTHTHTHFTLISSYAMIYINILPHKHIFGGWKNSLLFKDTVILDAVKLDSV